MASGDIVYVESVIRGHHIYKSIWNPIIGEDLEVCREPDNVHDRRAVSYKRVELLWDMYMYDACL